jgi:hypothetical protein
MSADHRNQRNHGGPSIACQGIGHISHKNTTFWGRVLLILSLSITKNCDFAMNEKIVGMQKGG